VILRNSSIHAATVSRKIATLKATYKISFEEKRPYQLYQCCSSHDGEDDHVAQQIRGPLVAERGTVSLGARITSPIVETSTSMLP
jgi:hypothetical protein